MRGTKKLLTFDFGASSGRGILAQFNGERLEISEIHRFANDPVYAFGHYYWDILRLFSEIKTGMQKLRRNEITDISCIGIDTWGVDFALLDEYDKPLANPLYYRDRITDGAMERVFEKVTKRELYSRTGIQFMKFNTIFQLSALCDKYPKMLERARTMLLMPDLINFMLTGVKTSELSMASTTQLMDVNTRSWDIELFEKLEIPTNILVPISAPGRIIGRTGKELFDETGIIAPVASVCGHDTGSAVMAVPMKKGEKSAYLSCGTWSLLGIELDAPLTDEKVFNIEYTNEAGFDCTIRFLKNIMGLWIYQEVKRELELSEGEIDYKVLDAQILSAKPFERFIDPDMTVFFEKGQMIKRIARYCESTGQSIPQTNGEILRCVLESLALKYRYAIEQLESILGYNLPIIRVVGGGCKDEILMSFTAKATQRQVIAGPVEATAIGNTCAQLIAIGEINNLWEARALISDSFEPSVYGYENRDGWDEAYARFQKLLNK